MSKPGAATKYLRIGQIAERAGLSPKALRLYEARGLLAPDARSDGGYRLYGARALARLAEIGVLRRAGFTLAEIGALLEREAPATALIEARIVALRREVAARSAALAALERAWHALDSASPDLEQLLENIRMSNDLDMRFSAAELAALKQRADIMGRHFTPDERERFRRRAERLGEDGLRHYQQQWPALIAEVRAAMDAGTPANDPAVLELGRRWHALVNAFTGGDAGIARKLKEAYEREPQVMAAQGMDKPMFAYIREAMLAAGLALHDR
jgi:DNA-binding transcriptional MerR regulator